jgi:hypothetical protein
LERGDIGMLGYDAGPQSGLDAFISSSLIRALGLDAPKPGPPRAFYFKMCMEEPPPRPNFSKL